MAADETVEKRSGFCPACGLGPFQTTEAGVLFAHEFHAGRVCSGAGGPAEVRVAVAVVVESDGDDEQVPA